MNVCLDTDMQLLFSLEGAHGVNGMLVYARRLSPYDYTVYVHAMMRTSSLPFLLKLYKFVTTDDASNLKHSLEEQH